MKPIDVAGFGPKREVKEDGDGFIVMVTPPKFIGPHPTMEVRLTADQYERYLKWRESDVLLQDILPELSSSDREKLITGIGPEEWDQMYPEDDDED